MAQTFGYLFLTLPRRLIKGKVPKCDFDIWMVFPDPFKDGDGFLEWQDDEQVLGLGTAAHGE